MAKINHKHKTVGVSFNPQLRQKANRRARQLGSSFSRYVSLCVEAEVAGLVSPGALRIACNGAESNDTDRRYADHSGGSGADGGSFGRETAQAAVASEAGFGRGFEIADERMLAHVAALLERAGFQLAIRPLLAGIGTDFFVSQSNCESGSEGESGGVNRRKGIVVECCHPVPAASALLLGRAVMLQQAGGVKGVLLCVPYLNTLSEDVRRVFEQQNIGIATPDTLLATLLEQLA